MKKKKLHEKDKKVLEWVKKGGRKGAKQDFELLFKLASPQAKSSQK